MEIWEDFIRNKVKDIAKKIQSLKARVIVWDLTDGAVHEITVDGVNYSTHEFRLTPSTKFYDHKTNGCGVKYEFALSLRSVSIKCTIELSNSRLTPLTISFQSKLVWMKGPIPAGEMDDRTFFCGGTKKEPKENWDKSSLYFKLPEGKKAIGDSIYEGIPEKVTVVRRGQSKEVKDFLKRALARQESYHSRLHAFQVLGSVFRHNKNKMSQHQMCTEAVCVLVQFDLRYRPLMDL